jgi:hypothetical protein
MCSSESRCIFLGIVMAALRDASGRAVRNIQRVIQRVNHRVIHRIN